MNVWKLETGVTLIMKMVLLLATTTQKEKNSLSISKGNASSVKTMFNAFSPDQSLRTTLKVYLKFIKAKMNK